MKPQMSKSRKTRSIQVKISIIVISLTTLILLIFGAYQYYDVSTRKSAELRLTAENASSKLAEGLVLPLWNYDRKQTAEIMLSEMRDRDIYGVLIRSASGDTISAGKIRDENWQIVDSKEDITKEFIVSSKPVLKEEETLSIVEVYVTQRFLRQELLVEMIKIVSIVLVLDISIFMALTFTLQRMLLRPIQKLLMLANGIAAGNFDQTIEIEQQDEIGTLAEAFQTMQTTIGHVLQDLQVLIKRFRMAS
jgi:methyl-accepting chemotaxis protein